MSWRRFLVGGAAAAVSVGALAWTRQAFAKEPEKSSAEPEPEPNTLDNDDWLDVLPLPSELDVSGDLERNWGDTPQDLRPFFLFLEEKSGIKGSGRIFSIISAQESAHVASAHNDDDNETYWSCKAYVRRRGNFPHAPLAYGVDAALYGSGGHFGALAPYFLWTGVVELRENAPLLGYPPEVMNLPRVAGYGACVYLYRTLRYHQVEDHADIKVGWASPSYLRAPERGGSSYLKIRTRFFERADKMGIDLDDESTIPGPVLDWRGWRGFDNVLASLLPKMPRQRVPREPRPEKDLELKAKCLEDQENG